MDTIRLTGVRANGTHGVLDFEHERAQPFIVDATLHLDLAAAGRTDALGDTVDYGRAAKEIVAVIEGPHVDLIERLAQIIADRLLAIDPIRTVDVTVHKPHAPITVPFDDVAVSITRSREALAATGIGAADAVNGNVGEAADAAQSTGTQPGRLRRTHAHHAVIALGGNLGDVKATLRDAIRRIDALAGTQVTGISPLYRTVAWGMGEGTPDFLNAVASVTTTLDAHALLAGLNRIEAAHGRTREDHWSARTLDLDIIDYDGFESDDPDLTLPHPRAWQRAFVLVPWAALDPHADLPGLHGGPVAQLAEGLLAEADGDEPPVALVQRDWMTGGGAANDGAADGDAAGARADGDVDAADAAHAAGSADAADASDVDASDVTDHAADPADDAPDTAVGETIALAAVISMDSTSTDAERQFRESIVAIDGLPGTQVDGISPLYHVSRLDGPDAMSAVIQIETTMGARALVAALGTIEAAHDDTLDLDLVDMDGITVDEPECRVPWPSAKTHAAVLAPWMDMDPEARLGGEPVSFLLAMAPDAAMVGMLSDDWIIGAK